MEMEVENIQEKHSVIQYGDPSGIYKIWNETW